MCSASGTRGLPASLPGGKQPTAKAGERKDTWEEEEEEEAGLGQQPVEMPAKGEKAEAESQSQRAVAARGCPRSCGGEPRAVPGWEAEEKAQSGSNGLR